MKRINHNDLIPWFLEDHADLPAAYVASCQKFFDGLRVTSNKLQAPSLKKDTNNS